MMKRYALLASIALLIVCVAFIVSRLFKETIACHYVGYQGEAQRNEHLAAQRLLQRTGFNVQHLRGLDGFQRMPANASLLWSRAPSEGERERLLGWVKGGGHLVLVAPYSQDTLLREIGVQPYDLEEEGEEDEDDEDEAASDAQQPLAAEDADTSEAAAETEATEDSEAAQQSAPQKPIARDETAHSTPGEVAAAQIKRADDMAKLKGTACTKLRGVPWERGEESHAPLKVRAGEAQFNLLLPSSARLQSEGARQPALRSASDEEGAVMLEYALGRGRITALTGGYVLDNELIGAHDHAAWLGYLVAPAPGVAQPQVWFADVPLAASLWRWLRQYAWPVLLSGAICAALGLWRALTRFGPLLPDAPPGRLSFRDHLVACGRFHWRHGAAGKLLQSVEQEAARAELGVGANPNAAPAARPLIGRANEIPAFVQRMRTLQRRLSEKNPPYRPNPINTKDAT